MSEGVSECCDNMTFVVCNYFMSQPAVFCKSDENKMMMLMFWNVFVLSLPVIDED